MNQRTFWSKRQVQRRVSMLALSFFSVASVMTLTPNLPRPLAVQTAHAAIAQGVADKPNLGKEGYWNFYSRDLGAGWNFSVNTATGNVVLAKTLLKISGRALPLTEDLVYNSQSAEDSGVGAGWTLGSSIYLQENADGSVTIKDDDATNQVFTKNADGTYKAPTGTYFTLTALGNGAFSLKAKDQNTYRFDQGRLTSITDQKGNRSALTYNASGQLAQITDPSGRALTYAYDANGRLETITDPGSRITRFGYDANGLLASVTDPGNSVTQFEYDATTHRLQTFIDAKGQKTTFLYDANGRLLKTADARSVSGVLYSNDFLTTFAYDDATRTTTITDAKNNTMKYTHNAAGNMTQSVNGEGNTLAYDWSSNEITKSTDSKGSTTTQYDANGNVTQNSDTISATVSATSTTVYDAKNNPVETTDPNNSKTISRYDANSNQISSANPQRMEADGKVYDSVGNLIASTETQAATTNLLENGSFERLDANGDFVGWYKGGNTALISADPYFAYNGGKSLSFNAATTDTAYIYSNAIPVKAGQKWTLSAKGAVIGVTGTGGADIGLEYYDANFNYLGSNYSNTMRGNGNLNFLVTSTAPANAAYVYAVLEQQNATGNTLFDGVQLETPLKSDEGYILTDFDYVENSGFEQGGYLWGAGGDGVASVTTEAAWGGTNSLKIDLATAGSHMIASSEIAVRGGEKLTLSGFIKTNNLTGDGAQLEIDYYDANGNFIDYHNTKPVTGTTDFTRYAVSTTAPANAVSATVYGFAWNGTGTVYFDSIKVTPRATTQYGYDPTGNYQTAVLDPYNNLTENTYDGVGNKTSTTDPAGRTTSFTYDGNNNLTSVTNAQNNTTWYEYDPLSQQVAIRDARSASQTDNSFLTRFAYNELNKLVSVTDPLNGTMTHAYDVVGNKESTTYPNGSKVLYTYDKANRLLTKGYNGTTQKWTYTYDASGNATRVADEANRAYSYTYDGSNRLTSFTTPYSYTMNYTLDNAGNVTKTTDSNNKSVTYTYGTDGRLLYITDQSGKITAYRYDGAGRAFETIRGNGGRSVQFYDRIGRVTEISDPGNPQGSTYYYEYDANSNITTISGFTGKQKFTYDELNRLTSWTDESNTLTNYAYDEVGNMTQKGAQTFTYNADNQITNAGYAYDANGNLTRDEQFNYTYDSENHLIKVTKVADNSVVATYAYDYRGLRISKTVGTVTTYFHYDDKKRLVRESNAANATLALYVYNKNDQLVAFEQNGAMYYVHTNHRGDILGVTDANKVQVATYSYGPWGELLGSTGTVDVPFRYAGYYYDSETGLYYLKSRYYSPKIARFITKDDIDLKDITDPSSLNLYQYVHDNPIKLVDPDGTWGVWYMPTVRVALARTVSGSTSNSAYAYGNSFSTTLTGTTIGSVTRNLSLLLKSYTNQTGLFSNPLTRTSYTSSPSRYSSYSSYSSYRYGSYSSYSSSSYRSSSYGYSYSRFSGYGTSYSSWGAYRRW